MPLVLHESKAEALPSSKTLIHSIVEHLDTPIAVLDEAGIIVAVNKLWQSTEQFPELLLGESYPEAFESLDASNSQDTKALTEGIRAVLSGEQPTFSLDFSQTKSKGRHWFRVQASTIKTASTRFTLVTHTDISSFKKHTSGSTERIRSIVDTAADAIITIDDDIKTNTSTIRTCAQQISDTSKRMELIASELLNLSNTAGPSSEPESTPLRPLLGKILEDLIPRLKSRNFDVEIAQNLPTIWGNKDRLHQLFRNLLTNMIKYNTSPNPKIRIGVKQHENETHVFVSDNGPDIPKQYKEKVFSLFEHLPGDKASTDVGLALVRQVMEHHKGRVWVEDDPSGGARFWLAFPNAALEQPSQISQCPFHAPNS